VVDFAGEQNFSRQPGIDGEQH
jgi:hypothetical protein